MTLEWMPLCVLVFLTHFAPAMTCSTKNANFHLKDARRPAGTNAGNQQQVVLPISIEGADNCVEALYGSIH